ncbi:MAG: DnaB-like helicase N-terminal domain-containing protein, partial [Cyanobacteria bacterium J06629_18]
MIHQMPPANIEAEEAVLGGIILDPQAIARVSFYLISEAFYIKAHQDIYSAAVQLENQGKPTDLLTIGSWLSDHNLLESIG